MQIVKSSGQYRVYGENIEVYDTLAPYFYQFNEDDGGPFLVRSQNPTITDKVYGSDQQKVSKCYKTYEAFTRSLGVMLVGDKGNGKTLFAKQLCIKMLDAGYPVINVTKFSPSLPTFMTQISQECVFLFDEFEKMFPHDERQGSAQNLMLSTFDGINMSKKMFIITCNDIDNLSQYIYNRPGRFHYSFTFTEPAYQDIQEYLNDNINPEACTESIKDITLFSYVNGLNYDCLRSIVFELNRGYSLVETFDDLNIGYAESKQGKLTVHFDEGLQLEGEFSFVAYTKEVCAVELRSPSWCNLGYLRFKMADIDYSKECDLHIPLDKVTFDWFSPGSTDNKEKKENIIKYRAMTPTLVSLSINRNEKINPLRLHPSSEPKKSLRPIGYYPAKAIFTDVLMPAKQEEEKPMSGTIGF